MRKNKLKRKKYIDNIKIIMHKEYDHELYKFQHRKRYIKDDNKRFRNKRNRRKEKMKIKKYF